MEEFSPLVSGEVNMYVCGPTVYDDCHLGHARAMVAFDVVVRWLEYLGYRVTYVRNITDVDDKIIKRAAERAMSCEELTGRYIKRFQEDMSRLSLLAPAVEPRATEHIADMQNLISRLIERGMAYVSEGDVYYEVERFEPYGKFSGRKPEELLAGARVDVGERKKGPLDFALWKSAKPGEPRWPSPWGPGRPGWHTECAAMSARYFGGTFDIHGGGSDLIFPHHENEIAEYEGATGTPLARFWLHNAHVTVNETKMSKSLGNFFTLAEIYAKFPPRVVRFFLSRVHYRAPIDFSDRALEDAAAALGRIEECVSRAEEALGERVGEAEECAPDFEKAMNEDFNATAATGGVFRMVSAINRDLDGRKKGWRRRVESALSRLKRCCAILGVEIAPPRRSRISGGKEVFDSKQVEQYLERDSLTEAEIRELVGMRIALRKRKEFELADRIRRRIEEWGYEIRDDRSGGAELKKI